eukprot:tig00020999_g16968.t1
MVAQVLPVLSTRVGVRGLYRLFLEAIIRREIARAGGGSGDRARLLPPCLALCRRLAAAMLRDGRRRVSVPLDPTRVIPEEEEAGGDPDEAGRALCGGAGPALRELCPLRRWRARGRLVFAFSHPSFQDFFASEALLQSLVPDGNPRPEGTGAEERGAYISARLWRGGSALVRFLADAIQTEGRPGVASSLFALVMASREAGGSAVAAANAATVLAAAGVSLAGRALRGVRIAGACLRRLEAAGADLQGADLTGCDLTGANLAGADIRGAKLEDINYGITPPFQVACPPNALSASANGRRLAATCRDRRIRVLDGVTGAKLTALGGPDSGWKALGPVALSSDGLRLASAVVAADGSVSARIWDAQTGADVAVLDRDPTGTEGPAACVALSEDGSRVMVGTSDGGVRLHDGRTGRLLRRLAGHAKAVTAVSLSASGNRALSASEDGTAIVWDDCLGVEIARLSGHTRGICCAVLSADGRRAATCDGPAVRVFSATTGALLVTLPRANALECVTALAISSGGSRLATGSSDGRLVLWDAEAGSPLAQQRVGRDQILSVALSAAGDRLFSTMRTLSLSGRIHVWDANSPAEAGESGEAHAPGHSLDVQCVAVSSDGARVVSGGHDKCLRVFDGNGGAELRRIQVGVGSGSVWSVSLSPCGRWAVVAAWDFVARIFDTLTGVQVGRLKGHEKEVLAAAYFPDGNRVVTGSHDRTVRIWDASRGEELRRIAEHSDTVTSVAVSPDGEWLVSGGHDGCARIFDVATGRQTHFLSTHKAWVESVAVSPDGKRVAASCRDGGIRVWSVNSGTELLHMRGHVGPVWSVAFSPDGAWLASAGEDGTVRVWDGATGSELQRLAGHAGAVRSVAVSSTDAGARIVSGGADASVRVWAAPPPLQPPTRAGAEAGPAHICPPRFLCLRRIQRTTKLEMSKVKMDAPSSSLSSSSSPPNSKPHAHMPV